MRRRSRTSASRGWRWTPRTGTAALPAVELLDRVGLAGQAGQTVSTMSGGQRQRLALACAVATGPDLLLADEPTSQLSHEDRDHVLSLIHALGDDLGSTILVVTHQPEVAATFPRTITMKGGRVGSEGRDGSEYVVIGEEGVLHLPGHFASEWPAGTLVRIEPETADRLLLSRPRRGAGTRGGGRLMSALEVRNVTYTIDRVLLDDISLEFHPGS